jgi:hypothetical protein
VRETTDVIAEFRTIAGEGLAGRRFDPVDVVERLLDAARGAGEVRGSVDSGSDGLAFTLPAHGRFVVPVEGARGKLRILCARLSVVCLERGGSEVSPYGGEGRFDSDDGGAWSVRFTNTPSQQEFEIRFEK